MKHLLIILALATSADVRPTPAPAQGMSREERAWRQRHPEIPSYAPYTPDYGPYIDENGRSRFKGWHNPYYREEYPRIDYCRVFCSWGGRCERYCR